VRLGVSAENFRYSLNRRAVQLFRGVNELKAVLLMLEDVAVMESELKGGKFLYPPFNSLRGCRTGISWQSVADASV
jgi:hypothetical protein